MKTPYDPSTLVRDYQLPPRVRWCVIDETGDIYLGLFRTRNGALAELDNSRRYSCMHGCVVRKVLMFVRLQGRKSGRRS